MYVYLLKSEDNGKTYFWEKHHPMQVFVGDSLVGLSLGFDHEYSSGFTVVPHEQDVPPKIMTDEDLAKGYKEPEIRDAK